MSAGSREENPQRKVKGISRPAVCPTRHGISPARGASGPALRLPACLSVWFRKTSKEETWEETDSETKWEKTSFFFFFAKCVCVCVCVSILSGGCSHPCSFQKSPDGIPRAYKASFSIRKDAAVKAADGLALRGPELGLITLLLPGMILVVSCGQAGERSREKDK